MGDRGYAFIKIGGTLHEDAVEGFCAAIRKDAPSLSYDGGSEEVAPSTSSDLIRMVEATVQSNHGRHLVLSDPEAVDGIFNEIEIFCIEHGLSLDRYSSAVGEFGAEWFHHRPGQADGCFASDSYQNYLVSQKTVDMIYEKLRHGNVLDAMLIIDNQTMRRVSPLPPFKIEKKCGTILEPAIAPGGHITPFFPRGVGGG